MQTSTVRELVNFCLETRGLKPIKDDAAIKDRNRLDKYQTQALRFLDLSMREVALGFSKRFLTRPFTITTNATAKKYKMGSGFSWEGVQPNTFFNVTLSGRYNGPLAVISHTQWRELYKDPDSVPRGAPRFLVQPPEDSGNDAELIVFPYADSSYTIECMCRLDVPPLTSGSQRVLIPRRYEHILIFKCAIWLESVMNEGRQGDIFGLAREVWSEILVDSGGAQEIIEKQDFGVQLYRGGRSSRYVRDYDPDTDTVTQV